VPIISVIAWFVGVEPLCLRFASKASLFLYRYLSTETSGGASTGSTAEPRYFVGLLSIFKSLT
jgi:hypothetical protein